MRRSNITLSDVSQTTHKETYSIYNNILSHVGRYATKMTGSSWDDWFISTSVTLYLLIFFFIGTTAPVGLGLPP
jgi:hypothetical protein